MRYIHSYYRRYAIIILLASLMWQGCQHAQLNVTGEGKTKTQLDDTSRAVDTPQAPQTHTSHNSSPPPTAASHPAATYITQPSDQLSATSPAEPEEDRKPAAKPTPPHASQHTTFSTETPQQRRERAEFERTQRQVRVATLREDIETASAQLSSLSLAGQADDPEVVALLFENLEKFLEEERVFPAENDEMSTQAYLTQLKENYDVQWSDPTHRKKLNELLEQAYAQNLKRLVMDRALNEEPDHDEKMATVLTKLATLHQEQGKQSNNLAHYTDAAILHQHALQLWQREEFTHATQIEQTYQALAQIRNELTESIRTAQEQDKIDNDFTSETLKKEIRRDQDELESLRDDAKERLKVIEKAETNNDDAKYIQETRSLFADIAKGIRQFLARLYQESEKEVGPAPCQYAVMGLGSMALQQITPYSDLEFAILMEDSEDEATLEKNRTYLRQLTHFVHLRVINLGETVLPMNKYDVSLDDFSNRGVNFDLGGKTPLGRKDKEYDLIQPIKGMMRYLEDKQHAVSKIDDKLPGILERTCFVYGNEQLHQDYLQVSEHLLQHSEIEPGIPVCQARAKQQMLQQAADTHSTGPIRSTHVKKDLEKFVPQFEYEGLLYDVKQEIYRLPDRLLYGLATYYGLSPKSVWDAIHQLRLKEIINEEATHHLQYAAGFAVLLRLRTYLYYGQQKEDMGIGIIKATSQEDRKKMVRQVFWLPGTALKEEGSLFKYYYTALPLHREVRAFFSEELLFPEQYLPNKRKKTNFFRSSSFYEDGNSYKKGLIYHRLMLPHAAIECWERAEKNHTARYGNEPHPDVARCLNNTGIAYMALGDVQKGLRYKKQALAMRKALYPEQNHPDVAMSLNNVGIAYQTVGDGKKGLKYKEQALAMYQALHPEQNHPDIAMSLNNVGSAYGTLGYIQKELEYYKQALAMRTTLYPGQNHPDIANSLNNVGCVYETLGDVQQGLEYQEQALVMHQTLYLEQSHPDIAMSLNSVGCSHQTLGNGKKGLEYKEQALAMLQALYPKQSHPNVAGSLNNVGSAYGTLGYIQKELEYYKQALVMYQKLHPDQNHPDVAMSLNNMGCVYWKLGDIKKGLEYSEKALVMFQELYPNQNHRHVAGSFGNMSTAYQALDNAQKGLEYSEKALVMLQELYPNQNHPDVAGSLSNVGISYDTHGNVQKGLEYFEKALVMFQELYPNQNHPEVADSLNNVGMSYDALRDTQKGLEYKEQALVMYQALYPGQNHPDIANSLNNVGMSYNTLGDAQKGLKYFEKALTMRQALCPGENHHDIAMFLNNIGSTYKTLGHVKKGLEYQEKALAMREALDLEQNRPDRNHPHAASSLYSIGTGYWELGEMDKAITYCERATKVASEEQGDLKRDIYHSLGCMYHSEAYRTDQKHKRQRYLEKAAEGFEVSIATCDEPHADILTEYANFLISAGELPKAYDYLNRTIASGDDEDELGYGLIEKFTIAPLLQERITQEQSEEIEVRALDYAYYLLIHHYEDFVKAGVTLEKTRKEYLDVYAEGVEQRNGQEGMEKQDEIAKFLLDSLQQYKTA